MRCRSFLPHCPLGSSSRWRRAVITSGACRPTRRKVIERAALATTRRRVVIMMNRQRTTQGDGCPRKRLDALLFWLSSDDDSAKLHLLAHRSGYRCHSVGWHGLLPRTHGSPEYAADHSVGAGIGPRDRKSMSGTTT